MMLPKNTKVEVQKRKIADIVFREDIYARIETKQSLITNYAENIEEILAAKKFIHISQNNILIDGYHRLKALESVYGKDCETACYVHLTDNIDYIELESYASNTQYGQVASREDNIRNVRRLFAKGHKLEDIQRKLSLSKNFVYETTAKQRDDKKEELQRSIVKLYLRAWNNQRDVAKQLQTSLGFVSETIDLFKNSQAGKNEQAPQNPYLYNIWNLQKQDNAVDRFGQFPQVFMENLLYYHTQPLDIIYDPFAGGGTTVDACKKMFRRYYCTDREVIAGREKDIRQREISQGIPNGLPKPDLVFLDPPYSLLAKGQYSADEEELGNMEVGTFFQQFHNFISELLRKKRPTRIAYVVRPFWNITDGRWAWVDPMLELYKLVTRRYDIEARYILPYSTQQYSGLWVNRAKENKRCLILNRELTIFTRNKRGS